MAMRNFYNQVKGRKVVELPQILRPIFNIQNAKSAIKRSVDNYGDKYIETDSIVPLLHVCYGGMAFSYLIALPEERRHLAHAQHLKEHGGH